MEDFVTFEIAKKLKEKGFIEECFARYSCSDKDYLEKNSYNPDTQSVFYCYNTDEDLGRFYIDAPIISQVLKWLREKDVMVFPVYSIYTSRWYCSIVNADSLDTYKLTLSDSYELAALAGIEYVLDNLI